MNLKGPLALLFALALVVVTIGLVLGIMYGLTKQLFLFGLRMVA